MSIHIDVVIKGNVLRESLAQNLAQHFEPGVVEATKPYVLLKRDGYALHCGSSVSISTESSSVINIVILDSQYENVFVWATQIRRNYPAGKIIIFANELTESVLSASIAAGAEGVVSVDDSIDEINLCIATVLSGRIYYPVKAVKMINQDYVVSFNRCKHVAAESKEHLTERQINVMELIENGFSNKEIARKLDIQLSTVKNHVHQILERLNVKSRCEAVAHYRQKNIPTSRPS